MAGKRKKHPNKEIEAAIQYVETKGWIATDTGNSAHACHKLRCPFNKDCPGSHCQFGVWKTPRSPENHANQIMRNADKCAELLKRQAALAAAQQQDEEEN